jgi:hypothetical protein
LRVLACGSRDWTDGELIRRELSSLQGVDVVIEGEAPGADTLAAAAARELGIPVLPFPADWDHYGRAAGPIRNQQMIEEGHPDLVLAFSESLNSSRGTADMVARARRARIRVVLVTRSGSHEIP